MTGVRALRTYGSLFSGGGGADLGAMAAGYVPLWGVESDPAISDVARLNGFHILTADVCAVDYATLPAVEWLHASPPCTNASQAKADGEETALDRELASAVGRAITAVRPAVFTLENVFAYRTFAAFAIILQTLRECGYSFDYWHLNAASYGVPQTRKRLILIAKHGEHRIQRPDPTHRDGGDMFLPPWVGWYSAIQDLIPTLPESRFAQWQLARLPAELCQSCLLDLGNTSRESTVLDIARPAMTVQAWHGRRPSHLPAAFIVDGTATDHGSRIPGAFLMRDDNAGQAWGKQYRAADEPAYSQSQSSGGRTFLIGGANTSDDQAGPGVGVSESHEPTRCVNASNSQHWRAWLDQGRVVSMSSRALSVFQSFPRSYILPEKNSLACKIIGNACCPLLFQRIGESL